MYRWHYFNIIQIDDVARTAFTLATARQEVTVKITVVYTESPNIQIFKFEYLILET